MVLPPQSTVTPLSTAPATQALLPAVLDAVLEATLLLALLEELLAALLATLEELDVADGPTEHQAVLVKLFEGNKEVAQVKLPVSVV